MKQQTRISQMIVNVGLVTMIVLAIPFVAMQFTEEVDWSLTDFVIIGVLVFGTGLSYKLITRGGPNLAYRVGVGIALGTALFMIWANLGVGLIGSGPNAGNFLYMGVLVVGLVGTFLSNFTPGGMERTMYSMALFLALAATVALLANMDEYPGSSVIEILAVSGFFASGFIFAGLFFRYAAKQNHAASN